MCVVCVSSWFFGTHNLASNTFGVMSVVLYLDVVIRSATVVKSNMLVTFIVLLCIQSLYCAFELGWFAIQPIQMSCNQSFFLLFTQYMILSTIRNNIQSVENWFKQKETSANMDTMFKNRIKLEMSWRDKYPSNNNPFVMNNNCVYQKLSSRSSLPMTG